MFADPEEVEPDLFGENAFGHDVAEHLRRR
jgi:hypothetical protein